MTSTRPSAARSGAGRANPARGGARGGAGAEPELSVREPKTWAAGVEGVGAGVADSWEQMGAIRSVLTLKALNQHGGFDCPGCAWPEPGKPHIAEFCENGMKAVAEEATVRRIGPDFFKEHSVDDLRQRPDYWLGQQGRLTHPVVVREGSRHYEPISWQAAFSLIADELHALASPDEAVFYTSGRTSNEAAFVYQLFVRAFGTNNLPDCSNMCHESSGSALSQTIGIGKGSVTLEGLYQADLIIIAGQNPGTNHPRMLTALERAKQSGAHMVALNPLPEPGLMRFKNPQKPRGVVGHGTQLADDYLQLRVNGDLALFQALNALLLEAEERAPGTVLDRAFIDEHTAGFDEFASSTRLLNWDDVATATGLSRAEIEKLAERIMRSDRIVVCWAMGLTQHKNSVPTIREIVNFLLLRGNIGRPGAGVLPVRGHSNVQGDRTMGIWEKPKPAFLDALEREFHFNPPREHGVDVVGAIRAMRDGKVKVFFSMGGNFAAATPDAEITMAALENLRLNVQVSTKLNRSHTIVGRQALILPTLGRTEHDIQDAGEQFVSVEDSMGTVHSSQGVLNPASRYLKSEVAIICELARTVLGAANHLPWREFEASYDRIRDSIARVVPGFEDFNTRVREPGGFLLPHAARDSRTFNTDTGKANFTTNALEVLRPGPGRLILQTVRSHDQYNTTIYGLNDRYRGIHHGRRVVFVNPADLASLGFADGEIIDIVSEWADGIERRAREFRVVSYPTARGCAAAYFPEANVLVPLDSTAETSNTPVSKSTIVRLEHRESVAG
jgi:molybdopterin-dependent oxidoreductase alpha subunit